MMETPRLAAEPLVIHDLKKSCGHRVARGGSEHRVDAAAGADCRLAFIGPLLDFARLEEFAAKEAPADHACLDFGPVARAVLLGVKRQVRRPAASTRVAVLAGGALAEVDVASVRGVVVAAVRAGELVERLAVVGARDAERADVELAVAVEVGDFGCGV